MLTKRLMRAISGLAVAAVLGIGALPLDAGPAAAQAAPQSPTETRLHFRNQYLHPIDLVIAYADPAECTGSNWMVRGWYSIKAGEQAHVLTTMDNHAAYYAYAPADGTAWSGTVITVYVPTDNAFGSCQNYLKENRPDTRSIGLRQVWFNTGGDQYIDVTP